MKVLMTADTVGGVWTYALELCRALAPHGVRVALATQGARLTGDQRRDLGALANVELFESEYRLEWMSDPWDDVAAADRWLQRIAADFAPDVIHFNDYSHAALAWRAPTLVAGHSCVLSWHQAVRGAEAGAEWRRYRDRVAAGLRAADLVVAPTRQMLASLDRLYGPLRAARVILNGRDPGRFRVAAKAPFVLAAGRFWDEAKNLAALARAADRLDWPVWLAALPPPDGEGGRISSRPSGESIRFLGHRSLEEMARLYARAPIYALPARYEPFGLTALEAALSGAALVLGDIPTLREIWGDAACFVPPEADDALAAAANALIRDRSRRAELAAKARRRALALTADRMAQGYLTAYGELLAAPRRAARLSPAEVA